MNKRYKYWYIKERHNPQFEKPYFVALGKISAKQAKEAENTLYGFNYVHKFESEKEYLRAIKIFNAEDETK